jgi:putative ABC transport system substrate-binding protein
MIDRRTFLLAALATPALAAEPNQRARIGWLVFGPPPLGPIDAMLVETMAQRGLAHGDRIEIAFRFANGIPARLAPLAAELAELKPDLLIASGGDVLRALRDAAPTIPIVGGVSDNPVRAGFTSSLAQPDKNFTGVTYITDEMAAKRLELLKEVAPQTRRVAVIWNPQHFDDEMSFASRAALSLGLSLSSHPINALSELDQALLDVRADSLFVIPSRMTNIAIRRIADHALQHRLPVVTAWREYVDAGCLMSYGPSRINESRRLAVYVERILAGAKPAALPIELPTKFELVVNLRTAKAIGIAIPQPILLRADEVIE